MSFRVSIRKTEGADMSRQEFKAKLAGHVA
jgi:hypothetical protein